MIKLTDDDTGKQLTINEDHIVAYWWQNDDHTYVMLNGGTSGYATVKETPEQIDELLRNAP